MTLIRIAWGSALMCAATAWASSGGPYDLDWNTLDGGGGTCAAGGFALHATIGQPDAGGPAAGGAFTLYSGYWGPVQLGGACSGIADCADLDGDGIRDDPCLWWACEDSACQSKARSAGQADVGGFGGDCEIDDACDLHDFFHVQNCFANVDTMGAAAYPCEDNAPIALNVDAVGFAGSGELDGFCDINDAFAGLNCFADIDTLGMPGFPCTCDGGAPLPQAPLLPEAVGTTRLVLKARPQARAGDSVAVDVHLADGLDALQGYQVHLGVGGGTAGNFEVVDVSVDTGRKDYVFADSDQPAWSALNASAAQMFAGVDSPVTETEPGAYLATFTVRSSADAAGLFIIDARIDNISAVPMDRTFLLAAPAEPIAVDATDPAIIDVRPGKAGKENR